VKSPQRPRALRKPFVAEFVITDLISEEKISTRTRDLSVSGCSMLTLTPLNLGMKVRIAIVHAGEKVLTFGRVVSARTDGMNITFDKIEQCDQTVLEGWLSKLRDAVRSLSLPIAPPCVIARLMPLFLLSCLHALLDQFLRFARTFNINDRVLLSC
jgi:hypothetical protein